MISALVGALAATVAPASAQLETLQTPEIAASNRVAMLAFECAALATYGSADNQSLAPVLASVAFAGGLRGAEAMGAALSAAPDDALGPMTPFLREASADFFLGMALSTARKKIELYLDREAPLAETRPLATSYALRRQVADAEYARRARAELLP